MKNVFIDGGSGYLGRAFLRVLAKEQPDVKCTIFSRDHSKHSYCQREFPQHRYIIGDIRDYNSVEMAMVGHDTVIHMGAFKYVPEGETNAIECHEINVIGSINVARAAVRTRVDRVVGISTDKACQPVNVYGASKLLMERIFIEADRKNICQFNLVRYGNVVSSTGSAIPIFRRQAREGTIKLTNPDMTRFWLSVYEGVDLIMAALKESLGGTILIPRLPSLSIKDIAIAACKMEHIKPEDINFEVIGTRFGEKIHEDLLGAVEAAYAEPVKGSNEYMRLYPMTSKQINYYKEAYSSNKPDSFMDINRAIKMIEEAPE